MSKKRKQNKKRTERKRLPAKEHYKFDLLLAIFVIFNVAFIGLGISKNFLRFLNPDALFFKIEFSIFLILTIVFNLIILFLIGEFHSFATINNNIPFKNYFRGDNKKAKEKARKCFSKCGISFLISVICFLAATQIRTESSQTSIIKTNLFSHETLFDFKDAEKIEIKLIREDMNPRIAVDYSFTPSITITANNTVYELDANGFGYDYLKIEQFLSNFDSNLITVDSTHSEDVILAAEEQQAAFERIFIN